MLDDFGQRIRDIILSEMDLSRELSDEEICDLIGSVVSREARDRPMTIKDRAELERTIFNSLRMKGLIIWITADIPCPQRIGGLFS